jgi:PleD family two-component response regulator
MIGRGSTSGATIAAHRFDPVGQITASFGVTVLTTQDDFGSLVKRADAALYKAKTAGRNRVDSL